ncbi:hypothetical protein Pelo_360 [Pelomyxa schiedti]|nr:hypothetical protein Pelo_360 [Pelomyxa schiedti]
MTTESSEPSEFYCYLNPVYTSLPGAYLQYTATQDTILTATTCGGIVGTDTTIYVFTDCSKGIAGTCIGFNDDYCDDLSQVSWDAVAGTTYYIMVAGFKGTTGSFTFYLRDTGSPEILNDVCTEAEAITALPFSFTGNNEDSVTIRTGCMDTNYAGLWFSVVGTGIEIKASTCENPMVDTVIEIYSDCDGTCVAWNDDSCSTQSDVLWTAKEGVTYYIFVATFNLIRGEFTLTVDYYNSPSFHDCQDAQKIEALPFKTTASTANTPTSYSTCTSTNQNALWYIVAGTGDRFTAWTCTDDNYAYDTILDVYSDCDENAIAQGCIGYSDDFCGLNSKVEWETYAGKFYYISVAGFRSGVTGVTFSLTVEIVKDSDNSLCWSAAPVTALPTSFSQSTADAELTIGGCTTQPTSRPGRWFEVTLPDGASNAFASVCNAETTTPFSIEVYSSCTMSGCLTQSDSTACDGKGTVEWPAIASRSYWVFVTAGVDVTGDFKIDFYEEESNPNSECVNAIPLEVPSTVTGDTTSSSYSYSPCYANQVRGIWYSVVGNGRKMTISTCSESTNFDTVISVVQSCSNVTGNCIGYCDDYCGPQSEMSWVSEIGRTDYILVNGFGTASGQFLLNIFDDSGFWIPKKIHP